MKATIRGLHSPDVADLSSHVPDDPAKFGFLLQALLGPDDGLGEESFTFLVCTPAWLDEQLTDDGHLFVRHYLLVKRFDWRVILEALTELCVRSAGPSWSAVSTMLSRYGQWEFEDYTPSE
jgi:hypothetical protein